MSTHRTRYFHSGRGAPVPRRTRAGLRAGAFAGILLACSWLAGGCPTPDAVSDRPDNTADNSPRNTQSPEEPLPVWDGDGSNSNGAPGSNTNLNVNDNSSAGGGGPANENDNASAASNENGNDNQDVAQGNDNDNDPASNDNAGTNQNENVNANGDNNNSNESENGNVNDNVNDNGGTAGDNGNGNQNDNTAAPAFPDPPQTTGGAYFQPLGPITGPISAGRVVLAADGSVVVGQARYEPGDAVRAWRCEIPAAAEIAALQPAQHYVSSMAVSADGMVVVGQSYRNGGLEAYRATPNGSAALGDLAGGVQRSLATSVSAYGDVLVGTGFSHQGQEAFRWHAETGMVGLGDLPGGAFCSAATGISANGRIIAGWGTTDTGQQAFRLTLEDGMQPLAMLPGGAHSRATAVSWTGEFIVGVCHSEQGIQACLWRGEDPPQGLGAWNLAAGGSYATGVSADGEVVVGVSKTYYDGQEAFVWTPDREMRTVQDELLQNGVTSTDWVLLAATGVTPDGHVIVGYGLNPDGDFEAWMARLP